MSGIFGSDCLTLVLMVVIVSTVVIPAMVRNAQCLENATMLYENGAEEINVKLNLSLFFSTV